MSSFSAFVEFSLYLILPSLHQVHRHLGFLGISLFVPSGFLAVYVVTRRRNLRWISSLTDKEMFQLAGTAYFIFVFLYLFINPHLPHGAEQGLDNEDALNVAVRALAHGRYPYYEQTYLGNPIDHLPGTILLATPFVLLFGRSGFQNLFWIPMLFFAASRFLKNSGLALVMMLMIFLSPELLQNLLVGRDLPTNGASVLIAVLLLVHFASSRVSKKWAKIASAVFFGITLSSRFYFFLILPPVFSFIARRAGRKEALVLSSIAVAAGAAITLPFYFYDPPRFSPLDLQNEFQIFTGFFPHIDLAAPALCGLAALAIACRRMGPDVADFLRSCALVLLFPFVCGVIVSSLAYRRLDFEYFSYATASLFFGAFACWKPLARESRVTGFSDSGT